MNTVDQILDRWPLAAMLARCGINVPPRGKFCSPFRPDENPSCEVYRETIRDRSTGESFDSIRVFAAHKGISNAEAIKQLAAELPGREVKQKPKPQHYKLTIPPLHSSVTETEDLARLRELSPEGVDFARFIGTLGFSDVAGFPCWILTDGDKKLAEARRMDGEKFPAIGSLAERKAHTLRGSCKSWPLGMNPPGVKVPLRLPVWLMEGGPDYLAACDVLVHSIKEFLPVSMMGAGQNIHTEALPFFRNRHVRILAHPGEAGLKGASTWSNQLKGAGADVHPLQLDGHDLNELVTIHGAEAVANDLSYEIRH